MKRSLIILLALGASIAGATAQTFEMSYRDLIRPHGRPRSDAIYQSNLDYCYARTGASRTAADTPAFKKCMLTRGYRWLSTRIERPRSASVTYNQDSRNRAVGWHWEGGMRTCHEDCDNPEIPGSGFTCRNVVWLGMPMRDCSQTYP